MTMSALKEKLDEEKRKALLKLLTYEKVKGKPIYYRNYKKVLKGELPPEAVMGSGGLQAYIVKLIVAFLFKTLDSGKYEVLFNELGFLYTKGSWRNLDIAIFEKEKVKPYLTQDKLVPVAPITVIEVDTKADLSKYGSFEEYMYEKTKDLLEAGVEKVIWYMSKVKKVLVAQRKQDWIVKDWNSDVEVLENIKLNIVELLKEEGIEI